MKPKAVIFDFNGTLFYDTDKHTAAWTRFFETFGSLVPLTPADFSGCIIGSDNTTILRRYHKANITPEEIVDCVKKKENFYFEACLADPASLHLTAGAEEMFDLLSKNGIPFMIATGSAPQNIEFYFRHLPLEKWFTMDGNILYDDYSRPGKPAPDIYLDAAKRLGVAPGECVVVEDSESGYLSAHAAGIGGLIMVEKREVFPEFLEREGVVCVTEDLKDARSLLRTAGFSLKKE